MVSNTQRRFLLFVLYVLTFAWGVIAVGIGINALVKSNHDKNRVKKSVPPPTVININVKDVFDSGMVITVVSGLIALTSLFSLVVLIFQHSPAYTRILRGASVFLAFCTVWLFATLIPYDHFYATRSAKVTATINGIPLSQSIIQAAEKATGSTGVYKHHGYIRDLAIIPWITFLFAGLALVVSFIPVSSASAAGNENAHDEKSPGEGA